MDTDDNQDQLQTFIIVTHKPLELDAVLIKVHENNQMVLENF